MSGNEVLLKLKNKGTFFSDIYWSEPTWASYTVFVETRGAHTLLGTVIRLFIPASVHFVLHQTTTWRRPCLSRGFVDTLIKIWEGQDLRSFKTKSNGFGPSRTTQDARVHMYNCLYSTVQLTGARLASEEVSLTLLWRKEKICEWYTDR